MRQALVLSLALLAAGSAHAQEFDPVTDCRALFKLTGFLERLPDSLIEEVDGGCHFADVALDFGTYARFAVRDITLTGPDLMANLALGERPSSIELALTGIRLSPVIEGSPLTSYIMEMQQDPYDVRLAMSYDEAGSTLEVSELSLAGRFIGRLAVSGRVTGLTAMPEEITGVDDFPGVALESLAIDMNNRGLFTAFFAAPILGVLPYDQDPRPIIAAGQQALTATINALPEAQLSAQSKDVLSQLVADFPRPYGHYRVDVKAIDAPFDLAWLEAFEGVDDVAGLLSRLSITATFEDPEGLRRAD